jgi:uncharacterized protein YdhG (YjbR/CyaY superfamily)
MYKTPTFAEPQQYNNTTDLFPRVSYQLSSFRRETGMLLHRSERKNKKSCNSNAITDIEMLEKYIYIAFQSKT